MITTVIFDLDDTLYDEMDYCKSGFSAVADFLARTPAAPASQTFFDAMWNQFSQGNYTYAFNAVLDHLQITYDQDLITQLVTIYRTHAPDLTLPPDSKAVLDALSKKYKLALLTDGFMPAQQLKTQALGIESYFQCIIYTELLGRQFWKPSPVGFQKIIETLNVNPNTVTYVADNEQKDFLAPNQLGFVSIKLIRPKAIHKKSTENPAAKPKYTIDHISKLPQLLQKC